MPVRKKNQGHNFLLVLVNKQPKPKGGSYKHKFKLFNSVDTDQDI